jgi:hypothetical protein
MLDRRTDRQFLRILTQNNSNSDPIPDEPDGMVHEQDLPILYRWTERSADDLWVLGDEVEQSAPVDLEFAPWDEDSTTDHQENYTAGYHGWTNGSRRVSAAIDWSLRSYNKQGKQIELEHNQGCLGEFETAFDGEIEAIAGIMDFVDAN